MELCTQCTLHYIWDISGHPLLCVSVADDFSGHSLFLASHHVSTSQLSLPKD